LFTNSNYSNEVTFALTAPSLSLMVSSTTQINLSWTDITDENGYKIERSYGNPGAYIQIGTVSANTTLYEDKTVTPFNYYYYRIKAYNDFADSPYSNEAYVAFSGNWSIISSGYFIL